ncbi:hypothetical protein [Maliponia aquimaris]|uniref:Uncharacterized protein n=1 Tax=Maliponia aquimaris TaxID=1673631 RepID=A0A238L3W3_9RHOB|nr:hypothetical protein [Maliponia aquimaris]SMX49102.1 hypothetical protein MAA8898_04186 [Maliponia aquimaris]
MSGLLTFGNIASAIGCLAAGFALGQALTGSTRYDEGVSEGRAQLAVAEDALAKLNQVIAEPSVTAVFSEESRAKLAELSEAVATRDYDRIDALLPFALEVAGGAGCVPNGTSFTVTAQDNVKQNCETGVTSVFVVVNPNRIDTTLGTEMKSLVQGNPKTWALRDGGECTVLVSRASVPDTGPTADILFQNCKGS